MKRIGKSVYFWCFIALILLYLPLVSLGIAKELSVKKYNWDLFLKTFFSPGDLKSLFNHPYIVILFWATTFYFLSILYTLFLTIFVNIRFKGLKSLLSWCVDNPSPLISNSIFLIGLFYLDTYLFQSLFKRFLYFWSYQSLWWQSAFLIFNMAIFQIFYSCAKKEIRQFRELTQQGYVAYNQ